MRSNSQKKQSTAPLHQKQKAPGTGAPSQSLQTPPASAAGSALEKLLQRYINPGLDDTARDALTATVRQHLDDPWCVARSAVLPQGHPLKVQAEVICTALTHVVQRETAAGETAQAVLAPLSQIPRRSPFAPYVMAIRAIHALYSGELEQARQLAAAVGEDSPAWKLGRAVRALAGEPVVNPTKAMRRLMAVSEGAQGLEQRLAQLDRAFAESTHSHTGRLLKELMRDLKRDHPRLVRPVREEAARRWVKLDWPPPALYEALALEFDTPERAQLSAIALEARLPEESARFWISYAEDSDANALDRAQILTHAAELIQRDPDFCSDCGVIHGDMESAGMNTDEGRRELLGQAKRAGILNDMPDEFRRIMEAVISGDVTLPDEVGDETLDPLLLLEQARTLDPQPETFAMRVKLLEEYGAPKEREAEFGLWSTAHPTDIRPLIALAELARSRGASRQALDFIQRAEAQDALNPEVKVQKLRLLLNSAVRRLKQNHPHLVQQDLSAMKALVGVPEDVRLPLIAALELLASHSNVNAQGKNTEGTSARSQAEDVATLARSTGDPGSAYLLLEGLCALVGRGYPSASKGANPTILDLKAIAVGIMRFREFNERLEIPKTGMYTLFGSLRQQLTNTERPTLSIPELLVLAETAIALDLTSIALRLSGDILLASQEVSGGAGPGGSGPGGTIDPRLASTLLQRGQAWMMELEVRRAVGCLRAAFTLARRQGDSITQRLALRALQTGLGTSPHRTGAGLTNLEPLPDDDLTAILKREHQTASQVYKPVSSRPKGTARVATKKEKGSNRNQLDIPF